LKPGHVQAVLFDFGGVLIEIDFDRVLRRWAALSGERFESLKARFHHGEAYQCHERGEITAARYYESLRQSLGINLPDAAFEDGWNAVFGAEIAPTVALLPALAARVPIYLFSNTNLAHYRCWSPRYAAALRPLHRIFVSFEMGLRKPEAASFEYVARAIGVPLDHILFFDDTVANINGARAVGMPAVLVNNPDDVLRAVAHLNPTPGV